MKMKLILQETIAFCTLITTLFVQTAVAISGHLILKDYYQKSDTRIINGLEAEVRQFPWQVAVTVQAPGGSFFCGGALISPNWVLTAAHCVEGASFFKIRLGATHRTEPQEKVQEQTTTTAIYHQWYNKQTLNYDIALIRLRKSAKISKFVKPIKLAAASDYLSAGSIVTVSGWGKTNDLGQVSEVLNYVSLKVITNGECRQYFFANLVIDSTVCAKGNPNHSACNGDSGGPLVQFKNGVPVHVGIVSFVSANGCTHAQPSGFIRTSSFIGWIQRNTGLSF